MDNIQAPPMERMPFISLLFFSEDWLKLEALQCWVIYAYFLAFIFCPQSFVEYMFLVIACKSHLISLDIGAGRRKQIEMAVCPYIYGFCIT